MPGGLCNQSPWCWGEGDPSLVGRPAPVRWPRRGRFPASQALGDRPLSPPSPPSPRPAWESPRGPEQSSRQAAGRGAAAASVPATATAWQQRAAGPGAINNGPAAAAVRPPAALRGKRAALSSPGRTVAAPTAPAGAPGPTAPSPSPNAHHGSLLSWGTHPQPKPKNKKNSSPEPQGGFWALSREAVPANPARRRPDQTGTVSERPARRGANPAAPSTVPSPPPPEGGPAAAGPAAPRSLGGWLGGGGPPIAQTRFASPFPPSRRGPCPLATTSLLRNLAPSSTQTLTRSSPPTASRPRTSARSPRSGPRAPRRTAWREAADPQGTLAERVSCLWLILHPLIPPFSPHTKPQEQEGPRRSQPPARQGAPPLQVGNCVPSRWGNQPNQLGHE